MMLVCLLLLSLVLLSIFNDLFISEDKIKLIRGQEQINRNQLFNILLFGSLRMQSNVFIFFSFYLCFCSLRQLIFYIRLCKVEHIIATLFVNGNNNGIFKLLNVH